MNARLYFFRHPQTARTARLGIVGTTATPRLSVAPSTSRRTGPTGAAFVFVWAALIVGSWGIVAGLAWCVLWAIQRVLG